jgi:hypothetical protein
VGQWFFPAKRFTHVVKEGEYRRHHMHDTQASQAIRRAVRQSAIPKRVGLHAFRSHLTCALLPARHFAIRHIALQYGFCGGSGDAPSVGRIRFLQHSSVSAQQDGERPS